jgi:hypothetical protein
MIILSSVRRLSIALAFASLTVSAAMAAPPKVVKATPDNGAEDVDPGLKMLRIEFDQPMDHGGMSIVGGGPKFPKLIGNRPRWLNDRTMVMNWKLEPNHEYWLSINSSTFTNFRSKTGEAAEPYPIAFKTGAAKGPPASQPSRKELNHQAIDELKQAIDKDYSYRDLHKLDWPALFKAAEPKLEAAQNAMQFAQEAAKLLGQNKDMHLWLKVGEEIVPSFRRNIQPNIGKNSLQKLVPGFTKRNDMVSTGKFEDGIGYIMIRSWPGDKADQLQAAFDALTEFASAKGVIIDVRANGGGAEPLAQQFAGCFIDKPKVYAKDVIRRDGEFSKVLEREFSPSKDRPKYRGPVAVLTGPVVMSSCESFLLMMKQVPNCKLVGAKSYGSSGNPKPVELPNGVTVFLPSWKDLRPDGTCFEGEGIAPDIEVKAAPAAFEQADPVLTAALTYLRKDTAAKQK